MREGPMPVSAETALRMSANITAAEAVAVFRRKIPGAQAEATAVFHPFWWTALEVKTGRKASVASTTGRRLNVLVNAYSGKGFIADFEPAGDPIDSDRWQEEFDASDQAGPGVTTADVTRTARTLVRTKVVKTVKLGMGMSITEAQAPRGVLKPNWLVAGSNANYSATILVDGLDSSHYIVRVEKLT